MYISLSRSLLSVYSMVTVSTYNWMDWFDRIYFPYHAHIMLVSAFDRRMCACVRCALFHSFCVYVVRVLPAFTFRIGEGVELANSYNFVFASDSLSSFASKRNFWCISNLVNWNRSFPAEMFTITWKYLKFWCKKSGLLFAVNRCYVFDSSVKWSKVYHTVTVIWSVVIADDFHYFPNWAPSNEILLLLGAEYQLFQQKIEYCKGKRFYYSTSEQATNIWKWFSRWTLCLIRFI